LKKIQQALDAFADYVVAEFDRSDQLRYLTRKEFGAANLSLLYVLIKHFQLLLMVKPLSLQMLIKPRI